jgi:pilus assembly protein CpaE
VLNRDQVADLVRSGGIEVLLGGGAVDAPELVVFGEDIPVSESFSMARTIDASYPDVEVVLVAEPEAELVRFAMRAGIRDIVPPSTGPDELKVLMHRASDNVISRVSSRPVAPEPSADRRQIIVVASPRGGTGKSTIASNVAVALAKTAPMETVLVDLDLQFGDAATLLNLKPENSIADAFESAGGVHNLILKTFLTVHPAGFYVLCADESPTGGDKVTADQVKHLLGQLSSQFRNVVVDTASGLNKHTMTAFEAATDLVLVSTMNLASTRAMRKEIDVLTDRGLLPGSCHVVLNFADRHAGVGVREIESALGMPVDVVIPRSNDVLHAGNAGVTLMARKSGGQVGKALRQLVKRIHTEEEANVGSRHRGIEVE